MSYHIHSRSNKQSNMIDLITDVDRRRNYSLYLCSCYFTPQAAKSLIMKIKDIVKLESVFIYIDRKEAIKYGRETLEEFMNSFRLFDVTVQAVETSTLFHSKSYSLVAWDENDEISSGSLVVGSANLTGSGLVSKGGNIESFLATTDLDALNEHFYNLDRLQIINIEDLERFSPKQKFNFKYALIQQGYFFHKWTDNLTQYFSVRFKLSPQGKEQLKNEVLTISGFNIDTATISKQYFKFDDFVPSHLQETESLIRNFGLETHLGYWIPKSVTNDIFLDELETFKEKLFAKLDSEIEKIKQDIEKDYNFLKEKNLIEVIEEDDLVLGNPNLAKGFEDKVEKLKNNDLKLKKIFIKYEIFELPYEIIDEDSINELFNEMLDVIGAKSRKNQTMKAFNEAYSNYSLEPVQNLGFKEE